MLKLDGHGTPIQHVNVIDCAFLLIQLKFTMRGPGSKMREIMYLEDALDEEWLFIIISLVKKKSIEL